MSEGSGLEVFAPALDSTARPAGPQSTSPERPERDLNRTLLFAVLVAASAALAFAIVRATLTRAPADPTTERIQQLIDEANRLLKTLDEKKPD